MDCKISVTTKCNAQCATCPVWQYEGENMSVSNFIIIWNKIMTDPRISRVLINNTGDMYVHPDRAALWAQIEAVRYKPIIMTTNAAAMDYVPNIHELIISFNGYDKKSYEHTTGLPFEETRDRIRSFYGDIAEKTSNAEIHCLIWKDTFAPLAEDRLRDLWGDFPGRVRISYKTDNQQTRGIEGAEGYESDHERVPCDYLDKINILPDGSVNMCAHDFGASIIFGNLLTDSVFGTMMNPDRLRKKALHAARSFAGLCENCNYNTSDAGKVFYVRG